MAENEEQKPQPQPVYIPDSSWTPLFKFLCAARSNDENRYVLRRVYCDEKDNLGVLVATDGKRIHILYNIWGWGFTKGVQYSATIDKDGISFLPITPDGTQYPNWYSVVNSAPKEKTFNITVTSKIKAQSYISNVSFKLGSAQGPELDGIFLKDLAPLDGNQKIRYSGELDAVSFSGVFGEVEWQAIIMPINNNPEEN